jgi:hydrogenase-4 component B
MKIPQGVLAFLCIVFGVVPLLPIRMIHSAISSILPANYSPAAGSLFGTSMPGFSLDQGQGVFGSWNPLWVLIAVAILFALGFFASRAGIARKREAETWYGGRNHAMEDVRYPSHSFYIPFKQLFSFTIGKTKFEGMYPKSLGLPKLAIPDGLKAVLDIDRWLYYPFVGSFMKLSRRFSRLHVGIPQVYVLWIILGVIACIIVLFLLPAN